MLVFLFVVQIWSCVRRSLPHTQSAGMVVTDVTEVQPMGYRGEQGEWLQTVAGRCGISPWLLW